MKRKYIIAALLIIAGLVSWAMSPVQGVTRQGFAMNTLIRMTAYTNDDKLIDDAYSLLAELDHQRVISTYGSGQASRRGTQRHSGSSNDLDSRSRDQREGRACCRHGLTRNDRH